MRILHLAAHLGGGAGKAITGMLQAEDTVILLENPEKDYYVKIAVQKAAEVLIDPTREVIKHKMEEADVVLINWWGHPLMVEFLAKLPQVECHLAIWNHVNGCVYPYLKYDFLNIFDQILFTTEFSYNNFLWTNNQRNDIKNKASIVYGMGEFHPYLVKPKASYRQNRAFTVGYLGTLNYAKLNPGFVNYCEAVEKKIPNVQFCLVGDLSDEVLRDIKNSPIKDKFECVSYDQDVEKYYKRFDVLGYLLNGYNYATTENVLLEAMAYGLPIIVLDNEVEKYIIHNKINGFVVHSVDDYVECVSELFYKKELREEIGIKAREYVCRIYDSNTNLKQFRRSMEKCLSDKKKTHEFQNVLGMTPYEYFNSFLSMKEQSQIEKLLSSNKDEESIQKNIFKQKSKGSVEHYLKYFENDDRLKKLYHKIKKEETNHGACLEKIFTSV